MDRAQERSALRPGRLWAALAFVVATGLGASGASLNDAGRDAYARGDFIEAERLFRQAVGTAPRDPLFRYHLAVALTRLGRYREAAENYEATLRQTPDTELGASARQGLRELASLRGAARPQAEPDETSIPLEPVGGGWVTKVKLNDVRTARFLVDTGASVTVISPDLAAELRIRPDSNARVVTFKTVGGHTSGRLVRIPTLRVGDVEAADVVATIIETGAMYDGILGNSFLARYTVQLDPRRGVLSLRPR